MWKKKDDYEKGYGYGGVVFVGCLAIGVGVGLIVNEVAGWTVIGFGIGFVLMGLVAAMSDRK
jgi:hypothetical protein